MNLAEATWEENAVITLAGPLQNRIDERVDGTWKRHRNYQETIAIHEAAHVVAAVVLGIHIEHVSILPVGTTLGHVQFVTVHPQTDQQRMAALEKIPVISEFRQAVREFVHGLREAYPKGHPNRRFRKARSAVREFLVRTESLLIDHSRTINAVAGELTYRRTIPGPEVEELVRYYESRPPAPIALDATTEKVLADYNAKSADGA